MSGQPDTAPLGWIDLDDEVEPETDDPTQRVHHHARVDGGVRDPMTLRGIKLPKARPDARELPCCPMCNATMGARGERCGS